MCVCVYAFLGMRAEYRRNLMSLKTCTERPKRQIGEANETEMGAENTGRMGSIVRWVCEGQGGTHYFS